MEKIARVVEIARTKNIVSLKMEKILKISNKDSLVIIR